MIRRSLIAIAMLLACAGMSSVRSESIIIGHTSSLIFMPSYVAVAKGYLKDEGIDAEIRVFRGGAQAMAAVISGDAHIYVGVPSTAMQAVAKGQGVKVYAAIMNQLSMDVVLQGDIAKSKGITSTSSQDARIQALKGLTMAVNATGGSPDQVLRFVLNKGGLAPEKDVTISPVGDNAAILAAFGRKRVDGFFLSPPTSDIAVDKFGGTKIFSFSKGEYEPLAGILYLGLISRTDWLAANPDRSAKIVRAFWRAEQLIKENPVEATNAARQYFEDMDKAAFEAGAAAVAEAIPSNPRIELRGMELSRSFSDVVGGDKFNGELSSVYTNDYVDMAAKMMK